MNATTETSNLARFLSESPLVCVEIGLAEIARAAGCDADQIPLSNLTEVSAKALCNRPEHVADILLVYGWMHAEALCTDAQRDLVRQHYLIIAQSTEDSLC